MGRISAENVASAVRKITTMNTSQQLSVFDEIAKAQPNLLASCLVQNRFGVGNGGLEHSIKMLLVCYQSMKESGFSWPVISEDEQERHLLSITEAVNFSRGLHDREPSHIATQQFVDAHPEQPLLTYVLAECASWLKQISDRESEAESDKFPLMVSLNIVNCIGHSASVTRCN
jgi:hypothetical protein